MNPVKLICFVACLAFVGFAAAHQQHSNSVSNNLKPSQWLPSSALEALPSFDEVNLENLESMTVQEGSELIEKLYHLAQIKPSTPSFVPSPSNIPVYIYKSNGQKVTANLNELVSTLKEQSNFGQQEVTIVLTGLPQKSQLVLKATSKLVQAYLQRYSGSQTEPQKLKDYDYGNKERTSSEEDYNESWKTERPTTGNLMIIDLGSSLNNFKRFALLDVEQTGIMIGKSLVQLTNELNIPHEIIHIVGQGIGAQVAGAVGRQYSRLTGHKLRRITALDPAKMFSKQPNTLTGLARGDAEFVDAIHTSAYGMGTPKRVGNVDFYPNGPNQGVPGATNVVEASMRATRYYAETVRPGNERNFPAVAATSLKQYNNNNGYGPRAYMGIAVDNDLEGDYMLQVNPKSPFGKMAPAQKQNTYHGVHQPWKKTQDYES